MTILDVAGITESGAHIYTSISVSEDYSETEVVKEIKRLDFVSFRLVDTMRGYAVVK